MRRWLKEPSVYKGFGTSGEALRKEKLPKNYQLHGIRWKIEYEIGLHGIDGNVILSRGLESCKGIPALTCFYNDKECQSDDIWYSSKIQ